MTLWYTARGAGLAALVMLSVATALGALGSVKLRSPGTRVVMQYTHRAAATFGLGLVLFHVTTIVLDGKSGVGVAGALVPFASAYRPGSVALGSIAAYALLGVAAVGVARGRLTASARGVAAWRTVHLLAYPAWAVAVVHGLRSGTDTGQPWARFVVLFCVLTVLTAVVGRLVSVAGGETIRRAMEPAS